MSPLFVVGGCYPNTIIYADDTVSVEGWRGKVTTKPPKLCGMRSEKQRTDHYLQEDWKYGHQQEKKAQSPELQISSGCQSSEYQNTKQNPNFKYLESVLRVDVKYGTENRTRIGLAKYSILKAKQGGKKRNFVVRSKGKRAGLLFHIPHHI